MFLEHDVQALFEKEGIWPNKNRGQHFLVDIDDLRTIARKASVETNETVLEIGAGVGNLTHELVAVGAHVIAVEKDERLVGILKRFMESAPVEVVHSDIRDVQPEILSQPYTVVGNIPYYITAPIVQQFLRTEHQPKRIVLTVQKEVGERLGAQPPKATFLSNLVALFADIVLGPIIPAEHFWPRPKVDSIVVTLTPHTTPSDKHEKLLAFIRVGFKQPRKTLYNNLRNAGYNNEKIKGVLDGAGLNQKTRAHELLLDEWQKLFKQLS